jgi:SAM-dependent methyltransferase
MDKRQRWNERYAATGLTWSAGPNELFAELAADIPPGRALDVATGEGRNALWLAGQGWQVDAIDFSNVGIDKGRQIAAERSLEINWIVADVNTHEFETAVYDLVTVLYLHTSAEERAGWLPALIQSVRPGGQLIYIGHDPANIEKGVGGPQDPAVLPGVEDLAPMLVDFDLKRAEIYQRPVNSDPGHGAAGDGVALDTLVWAVRR